MQLKALESLVYKFLWDGKPDKVARDHARLPEKEGGLGLPDLRNFWSSLKFSWIRRMCHTKAFWLDILEANLQQILMKETSIFDFLQKGPYFIVSAKN